MYLSKLELHGFKSFAHKTTLAFDPGVTAIVGPNGCGKSNIVDAVRWVIGEQRASALRSEKMANVIFNGTAQRRRLGMAEVQLTVENNRGVLPTEYAEVTLGRRLFRDGTSEYLLNGVQCRLKDITDLFMDTGMGADAYSVIELKMIDEILSDNEQDRRRLFEEAAGITRYKMRRRQTLRKLDATQTDLERVRDLADEIGTTVKRLKRQAKKAETHRQLSETLRAHEIRLARAEHARLVARQAALEAEAEAARTEAAALEADEAAAAERLEALRQTLDARTEALADARDALQAQRGEGRALEGEQRLGRERLARAERDREQARRAVERATERLDDLAQRIGQLEEATREAAPAAAAAEAERDAAEAARDRTRAAAEERRAEVRALRRAETEAADERARHRRALDKLASRLDARADERTRAQAQLDALDAGAHDLDARVRAAEAAHADARSALAAAARRRDAAEAEHERLEADVQAATQRLREAERRRDAAAAEVDLLQGLVASYDEFSDAVQFLASARAGDEAPLTTVADVLGCDEAVRLALDAALGDRAGAVVAQTEAEARAAAARLRDAGEGQATFVVLERLPADLAPLDLPATPLRARVRTTAPRYDRLADVLLRGVALAPSLDAAQAAASAAADGRVRVVAPTGEWAEAPGAVLRGGSAGAASPAASRLGRRDQLAAARDQRAALAAEAEARAAEAQARRHALDALDVRAERAAVRDAEGAVRRAAKALDRARYERETLADRRADLVRRIHALEEEIDGGADEVQALTDRAQQAEEQREAVRRQRNATEDALDAAERAERAALEAFSDANVAAVEARNRRDNLRRDLARARRRRDDVQAERDARRDDIATLQAQIDAAQAARATLAERLDAARAEEGEREAAVEAAREAVQAAKARIGAVEQRARDLREAAAEATQRQTNAQVRLAEVRARVTDLRAAARADFGLALVPARFPAAPRAVPAEPHAPWHDGAAFVVVAPGDAAPGDAADDDALRAEVQRLRRKLGRLGDVNPLALDEYERERERLSFLEKQQDDLARAEATLRETIAEINTTAAERFFATYDAVQGHFERIFTDLFGLGASATLELADPDDPLDSAIEIMAQPRGKRPSTLAQLSSGEKTLTATALLFAIYLVKPSPFCILDEVDAPLDDANVERFMQLIRRFEADTQFILVTHNQRTMALADRMYGITMEEQGVSKLVSVAFDEALELAS